MAVRQDDTQLLDLGGGVPLPGAQSPAPQQPSLAVPRPPVGQDTTLALEFSRQPSHSAGKHAPDSTSAGPRVISKSATLYQDSSLRPQRKSSLRDVLLWVVAIGAMAVAVFIWFNPGMIDVFLGGALPQAESASVTTKSLSETETKALGEVAPPDEATETKAAETVLAQNAGKEHNVWSLVKNKMSGESLSLAPPLTPEQAAAFKGKLAHQFVYQQYAAIVELSALRAEGTESLLREGIKSRKFWTRMRALIGLADLGAPLSEDDVKRALGDAPSELRERFFKRFEKSSCSPGCFFVARAALPFLDERGRAQVLRVISREKSDVSASYLGAASLDGSELVRSVAIQFRLSAASSELMRLIKQQLVPQQP